jgi:hypothetical protein
MADELKQSQLARIVVPAITDAKYSKKLADAFDKINDNFKKIASLPFLQGVQGDSYQLEEYPIWEKDATGNLILTEDGKILLDSIFGIDTTKDGNSFNDIRECIGQFMPEDNGVSPIDFFKSGNDIINNSLYFYVIKEDTGNVIEKQLGQYYYFIDGRLKEISSVYNTENSGSVLSVFNDYTGFYQYKYDVENSKSKYIKVEILPTLYYDQNKNDICWKFNGNETGISAIGVKGSDGKDADISIVKVDLNNENGIYRNSSTSGKVIGILDTNANNGEDVQWTTDPEYFKTGKAFIYMSGNIPVENQEEGTVDPLSGETETNKMQINDFAYGEIFKQNDSYIAYWEPNCVFSKVLTNNAFTQYFYNMGTVSYTNNAPYFLAIPSIQDRAYSTEEAKQHAHVIKGYSGNKDTNIESLNIFYSDDAFDEVGNQQINATVSNNDRALNIKNYNVNISKTLTTTGKITGETELEISGPATFGSDLKINVDTQSDSYYTGALVVAGGVGIGKNLNVDGDLGVGGSASIASDLTVGRDLGVTGEATIKGNLTIEDITDSSDHNSGALVVAGGVGIGQNLNVKGNLGITGAAAIKGNASFSSNLYISKKLDVDGTASFYDNLSVSKSLTVEDGANISCKSDNPDKIASLVVNGAEKLDGTRGLGLKVESGGAEIADDLSVVGTLGVSGGVTFEDDLSVGGTLGVIGAASLGGSLTVGGALGVTDGASFGGDLFVSGALGVTDGASFESDLTVGGNLGVSGGASFDGNLHTGGTLGVMGAASFESDLTVGGDLGVTGIATLGSDLTVGGTLGVTGAATLKNNLTVLGTTESNNHSSGALVVAGGVGIEKNLNVKGTLGVTGAATLGSATINGGASILGNLSVNNGNLAVDNDLTVRSGGALINGGLNVNTGVVNIGENLNVSGALGVTGKATFKDDLYVSGALGVIGTATLGGSLTVGSSTEYDDIGGSGALVVKGGVGIGKNLNIGSTTESRGYNSGALVVAGGVGIGKNLYVRGTLGVTGAASLSSGLTVGGTLGVTGAATLKNSLTVQGTTESDNHSSGALVVKGGVGIEKNLNVKGNLGVTGIATLGSDLTVGGDLGVTGIAKLDSDLTVGGDLGVTGIATLGSDLTVVGTLGVTGAATLRDSLTIGSTSQADPNYATSALNVQGGVSIGKNLIVGGTLSVLSGPVRFGNITVSSLTSEGESNIEKLNITGGNQTDALNVYRGARIGRNLNVEGELVVGSKSTFNNCIVINKDINAEYSGGASGALVVTGGVNIGKNLIVNGGSAAGYNHEDKLQGALVVTGGVNIGRNLIVKEGLEVKESATFANTLTVQGTTEASYDDEDKVITGGALVVDGGVGIEKNLIVKDNVSIKNSATIDNGITVKQGSYLSLKCLNSLLDENDQRNFEENDINVSSNDVEYNYLYVPNHPSFYWELRTDGFGTFFDIDKNEHTLFGVPADIYPKNCGIIIYSNGCNLAVYKDNENGGKTIGEVINGLKLVFVGSDEVTVTTKEYSNGSYKKIKLRCIKYIYDLGNQQQA